MHCVIHPANLSTSESKCRSTCWPPPSLGKLFCVQYAHLAAMDSCLLSGDYYGVCTLYYIRVTTTSSHSGHRKCSSDHVGSLPTKNCWSKGCGPRSVNKILSGTTRSVCHTLAYWSSVHSKDGDTLKQKGCPIQCPLVTDSYTFYDQNESCGCWEPL